MIEIIHEGNVYRRCKGQWIGEDYILAPSSIQIALNRIYASKIDLSGLSVQALVKEGDKFKSVNDYALAVRYYEEASKICDQGTLSYILPRISSCYRSLQEPQKAIEIFTYAKEKFGQSIVMSPALLTSAASAYCDMGDYEKAKQCIKIANKKAGGDDRTIAMVYLRIKKETGGL